MSSPASVFLLHFGPAFRSKSASPVTRAYCGLSTSIGAIILAVVLLCSLVGCGTKLPTNTQVVSALQQISELATVQYTVTKVVKANDNLEWYKIGDRKILITCEATIKAGIDLKKITADQVAVSGTNISIQLPPPQILSVNLPPQNIKIAWQQVNLMRSNFTPEETNALMVQAEQQMWESGKQLDINEQAKLNTESVINRLLQQFGFQNISLSFNYNPKLG